MRGEGAASDSMVSDPGALPHEVSNVGSSAHGSNLSNSSTSSPGAVVNVSNGASNIVINVNHYYNKN